MNINDVLQLNAHTVGIDSMSVLTPLKHVILSDSYFDIIIEYNEKTSEILNSSVKPIIYENQGIKIRSFVVSLFGVDYLTVVYTSKLLKKDYLRSIKGYNFLNCFEYVTEALGFSCNYIEYLKNSIVIDIDFKIDFHENDKSFSEYLSLHKKIPTAKLYRNSTNKYLDVTYYSGCQFVNRNDATITKPFCKFYSKYAEMQTRSTDFMHAFNIPIALDMRRLEVTLKNTAHFKHYDLKNKLVDVLAMTDQRIVQLIKDCYFKHHGKFFKPVPRDAIKNFDITLSDWMLCNLVFEEMQKNNAGMVSIMNEIIDSYPRITPASKSRKLRHFKSKMALFIEIQKKFDLTLYRETAKDVFLSSSSGFDTR